jgi:hypothetical protein
MVFFSLLSNEPGTDLVPGDLLVGVSPVVLTLSCLPVKETSLVLQFTLLQCFICNNIGLKATVSRNLSRTQKKLDEKSLHKFWCFTILGKRSNQSEKSKKRVVFIALLKTYWASTLLKKYAWHRSKTQGWRTIPSITYSYIERPDLS